MKNLIPQSLLANCWSQWLVQNRKMCVLLFVPCIRKFEQKEKVKNGSGIEVHWIKRSLEKSLEKSVEKGILDDFKTFLIKSAVLASSSMSPQVSLEWPQLCLEKRCESLTSYTIWLVTLAIADRKALNSSLPVYLEPSSVFLRSV